ncbi:MAG: hypothetical protein ACO3EL_06340, partial [Burkholderiaceae bacterium]
MMKDNVSYYSSNTGPWNAAASIRNSTSAYGNLLLLQDGGNVGIGVTPLSKLDVNGVITLRDSALTGSGRAEITSTAFVGITMASGNYVFNNATNTTEYARLTSTGLGIGTASPSQKLHIAGTTANILLAGTSNSYVTVNIGATNIGYLGDANWMFGGSSSDFGIRAT